MDNNLITSWCFRDGREYLVSINVNDQPKSIGIVVSDKITAEEWSCRYDLRYIEELTQRTGNYKPFDTFVSMIKTALLKKTQAVSIDLISYDDLKALKSRRYRQGFDGINGLLGSISKLSGSEEYKLRSTGENELSSRKYMIVTYVAEFDNVHYPIPLTYSGPPDPVVMQNTIRSLQAEISLMKNPNLNFRQKLEINSKNEMQQKESNELNSTPSKTESDASSVPLPHGILRNKNYPSPKPKNVHSHDSETDEIQQCLTFIHLLEEKIVSERSEHLEQMERLQLENYYLRDKIHDMQITEEVLCRKIYRLEQVVASRKFESQEDINNNTVLGRVATFSSNSSFTKKERKHRVSYSDMSDSNHSTHSVPENKGVRNVEFNESKTELREVNSSKVLLDTSEDDSKGNRTASFSSEQSYRLEKKHANMSMKKKDSDKKLQSLSRSVSPAKLASHPIAVVSKKSPENLAEMSIESEPKDIRSSGSLSGKEQNRSRSRSVSRGRKSKSPLPNSSTLTTSRTDRRPVMSQSPPRNVEERLKQRKKSILDRIRRLKHQLDSGQLEKQLKKSPLLQKISKNSKNKKSKPNPAKKRIGPKKLPLVKKQSKDTGIPELDLRLKGVESSLHALEALINGGGDGEG